MEKMFRGKKLLIIGLAACLMLPVSAFAQSNTHSRSLLRRTVNAYLLPSKKSARVLRRRMKRKLKRLKRFQNVRPIAVSKDASGVFERELTRTYQCPISGDIEHTFQSTIAKTGPLITVNRQGELLLNDCNGISGNALNTFELSASPAQGGGGANNKYLIEGILETNSTATTVCNIGSIEGVGTVDLSLLIDYEAFNRSRKGLVTGTLEVQCEVNGVVHSLASCNWDEISTKDMAALLEACSTSSPIP